MYADEPAVEFFNMLRNQYYIATHDKSGRVCVRDRMARTTTCHCLPGRCYKDISVRKAFMKLTSWHEDDLDKVFDKYLARMETLMGNEVANALIDKLKRSKKVQ